MSRWIIGATLGLLLQACGPADSPISGEVTIATDEAYAPMVQEAITVYESLFPDAQIEVVACSEQGAVELFLSGEVSLLLMGRLLTPDEEAQILAEAIVPDTFYLARDGIAVLAPAHMGSDALVLDTWQWRSSQAPATMRPFANCLFAQSGSGILRWLSDSIHRAPALPCTSYALEGLEAGLRHLAASHNTLGFFSAYELEKAKRRVDSLNLQVLQVGYAADDTLWSPVWKAIEAGTYPLHRDLFLFSREARLGVGTGIADFLAKAPGQRLIARSGLAPARKPPRELSVPLSPTKEGS